jgi:hypothetical protein
VAAPTLRARVEVKQVLPREVFERLVAGGGGIHDRCEFRSRPRFGEREVGCVVDDVHALRVGQIGDEGQRGKAVDPPRDHACDVVSGLTQWARQLGDRPASDRNDLERRVIRCCDTEPLEEETRHTKEEQDPEEGSVVE